MTLDMNEDAFREKLQILKDESGEMSWLGSRDFPKQKRVDPFPGACVKTWTENGEKIFINICHSKEIFPPEEISDAKLIEILQDDTPSFVIPMAIGVEKLSKDKGDIERPTFDILVNTEYFDKCMKKPLFMKFTIAAILEAITEKYNKNIDVSKYVVLKNKKVMGSLDSFNIEDRKPKKPGTTGITGIKKPLIQILDSKEINDKSKKTVQENKDKVSSNNLGFDSTEKDLNPKNYVIVMSNNQKSMIGYFYLPLSSITDLMIDIGENRIIVENQKTETLIDFYVPHVIDNNIVTAHYDSILNILRLTLPLKEN